MMSQIERLRSEVYFQAVRSRGPGGQNVNKVASAALLTWDFEYSLILTELEKERVRKRLANMINSEGQIYLRADEYRDLERNKTRCLEKLVMALNRALHVAKPRRATRPTAASRRRRVESKRIRSKKKELRRRVNESDD